MSSMPGINMESMVADQDVFDESVSDNNFQFSVYNSVSLIDESTGEILHFPDGIPLQIVLNCKVPVQSRTKRKQTSKNKNNLNELNISSQSKTGILKPTANISGNDSSTSYTSFNTLKNFNNKMRASTSKDLNSDIIYTSVTTPPDKWQTDVPNARKSTSRGFLITDSNSLPKQAVQNWMKKKRSGKEQSQNIMCFPNQQLTPNMPSSDMVSMVPDQIVFDESSSDNDFQFSIYNSVSLIDESTGEILHFPDGIPLEIVLNCKMPVQSRTKRKQTLKNKKSLNKLNISSQSKTGILKQTSNISDLYKKKSFTSTTFCNMLKKKYFKCDSDRCRKKLIINQKNTTLTNPPEIKKKEICKEQSQHIMCFQNQQQLQSIPGIDMILMVSDQKVFDESVSDNTFQFSVYNSVSLIEESTGEILHFPNGIPQEFILNCNLPVQSRRKRKQTLKCKKSLNELNVSSQLKTATLKQTPNISDLNNNKSSTSYTSFYTLKNLNNKNIASISKDFNSEIAAVTTSPDRWQTDVPCAQKSTLRSILLTENNSHPGHAVPNCMKKKRSGKKQFQHSMCFTNQLLTPSSPGINNVSMIPVQEVFDDSISDNTNQFSVYNSVSLIDESTGEIIHCPDGITQEIFFNHNLPIQSRMKRKQTLMHNKNLNELNISIQPKTDILKQTGNISDFIKIESSTSSTSCNTAKSLFTNKSETLTSKNFNSEIVVLSDDSDCIELLSEEDSENLSSLKNNDDADHLKSFSQKTSFKKSNVFEAQQEILFEKQKFNCEINLDVSNLIRGKLDGLENYTGISDFKSSKLPESVLGCGMLCDGNTNQLDVPNVDGQIIIQNTSKRIIPESSKECLTKTFIETKCNKAEPIVLSPIEAIVNDALVLCSTIGDKKTSLEYFGIKENFNENPDTCKSPSHLSFQNNTLNISNELLETFPENVNSNSTKHLLSNSNLDFVLSLNFTNDHNTLSKSSNKCQINNIETFFQKSQNIDNSSYDYKTNQESILNNNKNFNSNNDRIKTVVDISTSYCGSQLNSGDVTKIDMLPDVIDITTNCLNKKYQGHSLKDQVSNNKYQHYEDNMVEFSEDKMTSLNGPLNVDNKSTLFNYSLQNINKSSHSNDEQSTPMVVEQNIVKSSCQLSTNINLDILSSDSINYDQIVTKSRFILTNNNNKKFKKIKTTTGKKKYQQVLLRNTAIFLNEFESIKSIESAEDISKIEINKLTNKECKNELIDEYSQYNEPIAKECLYKNEVINKICLQNELKTKEFTQKNEPINEEYIKNIVDIAFLESKPESSILVDTASTFTYKSSYENFISYNFKKELTQVACSKNEFGSSQDNFLRGSSWSPDGQLILTNSNDNLLRVFKLPDDILEHNLNHLDMKPIVRIIGGETVYSTDWYPFMNFANPDSCLFLSSSRDHPVHLWDAVTGEVRCSYRAFDQMDELTSALSVSFNADGSKIYAGFNNKIRVFESSRPGRDCIEMSTVGKKGSRKKTRMQHGIVSCINFPKQYNGCYALGSFSKTVGLYDCNTDENICVMHGHKGGVTQVQFTNDGCYLFSGGRKDNEILCWDMRSTVEPVFKLSREVNTNQRIQFDIDRSDSYVFTGNTNHLIGFYNLHHVFDNLNDDECCFKPTRMFQAHEDVVNGVSLHPSLPLLVSTSGQRHFFVDDSSDSDSSGDTPTARKIDNSMRIWVI
ncbi:metacaspase-2 isoform X9 [Hydra vulgaris]|uniref:metacaspase-2 isoform X9 n=1 Tax=Hydra vulgaris TaxID=6087 RepID=UPI0032E9EB18